MVNAAKLLGVENPPRIYTEQELADEFGDAYDQQKQLGEEPEPPYRHIKQWFAVKPKSKTPYRRIALPKNNKSWAKNHLGTVIYGWVQPKNNSTKRQPVLLEIENIYALAFDRCDCYRGLWLMPMEREGKTADDDSQRPLYWLHEPETTPPPSVDGMAQSEMHLPFRTQIALLGNILDFAFSDTMSEKQNKARAKYTVLALHGHLTQKLGHAPWDMILLSKYKDMVLPHLKNWLPQLSSNCQFLKSLRKLKPLEPKMPRNEWLQRLQLAERQSKQHAWGEPLVALPPSEQQQLEDDEKLPEQQENESLVDSGDDDNVPLSEAIKKKRGKTKKTKKLAGARKEYDATAAATAKKATAKAPRNDLADSSDDDDDNVPLSKVLGIKKKRRGGTNKKQGDVGTRKGDGDGAAVFPQFVDSSDDDNLPLAQAAAKKKRNRDQVAGKAAAKALPKDDLADSSDDDNVPPTKKRRTKKQTAAATTTTTKAAMPQNEDVVDSSDDDNVPRSKVIAKKRKSNQAGGSGETGTKGAASDKRACSGGDNHDDNVVLAKKAAGKNRKRKPVRDEAAASTALPKQNPIADNGGVGASSLKADKKKKHHKRVKQSAGVDGSASATAAAPPLPKDDRPLVNRGDDDIPLTTVAKGRGTGTPDGDAARSNRSEHPKQAVGKNSIGNQQKPQIDKDAAGSKDRAKELGKLKKKKEKLSRQDAHGPEPAEPRDRNGSSTSHQGPNHKMIQARETSDPMGRGREQSRHVAGALNENRSNGNNPEPAERRSSLGTQKLPDHHLHEQKKMSSSLSADSTTGTEPRGSLGSSTISQASMKASKSFSLRSLTASTTAQRRGSLSDQVPEKQEKPTAPSPPGKPSNIHCAVSHAVKPVSAKKEKKEFEEERRKHLMALIAQQNSKSEEPPDAGVKELASFSTKPVADAPADDASETQKSTAAAANENPLASLPQSASAAVASSCSSQGASGNPTVVTAQSNSQHSFAKSSGESAHAPTHRPAHKEGASSSLAQLAQQPPPGATTVRPPWLSSRMQLVEAAPTTNNAVASRNHPASTSTSRGHSAIGALSIMDLGSSSSLDRRPRWMRQGQLIVPPPSNNVTTKEEHPPVNSMGPSVGEETANSRPLPSWLLQATQRGSQVGTRGDPTASLVGRQGPARVQPPGNDPTASSVVAQGSSARALPVGSNSTASSVCGQGTTRPPWMTQSVVRNQAGDDTSSAGGRVAREQPPAQRQLPMQPVVPVPAEQGTAAAPSDDTPSVESPSKGNKLKDNTRNYRLAPADDNGCL